MGCPFDQRQNDRCVDLRKCRGEAVLIEMRLCFPSFDQSEVTSIIQRLVNLESAATRFGSGSRRQLGKEELKTDLYKAGISLFFTSHDQRFIETVATRFW